MISRARATLTGLASLAALMLVVVGLPVVLYRFGGSPLPGHVPSWPSIETNLSSRDEGRLLLGVVRACSWLAWLLFTACVLAEAQAAIRHCKPPRLRLGGLQGGAAQLVALVALAFAAPSAVTLSASVTAVGHQPLPPLTPGHPSGGPEALTAVLDATAVAHGRLVVVRAGDCLWTLARGYLGAGDRYPEIVRLNYGHDMGGGQIFANPSLIQPGWRLVLPENAAAGLGPPGRVSSHHLGHASANLHYRRRHPAAWHGTRRTGNGVGHHTPAGAVGLASGDAPGYGADGASAAAGTTAADLRGVTTAAGARAADGPDSAAAAGAGQSATGDSGVSGSSAAPVRSSDAAAGLPAVGAGTQAYFRTSPGTDSARQLPDTAVFFGGALAGAVLTSLGRMRHRQRQERRRGRRIALPEAADVLATEQRLRAANSAGPPGTLVAALACLELGILDAGQDLPDIVGLHVTPNVLEVLLAAPAAAGPPPPYSISPGRQGTCWQLELPACDSAPGSIVGGVHGECRFLPGLITMGATAAGYLLIDLESVQVMACDGPGRLVDEVVTTIAAELATGQWSGWNDLVLVGCDELAELGRAEHCATLDAALDLLQARSAAVTSRMPERGPAAVRELRLREPDNEDWGLTILVSRDRPTPAQVTRLLRLVEDGPGGIAALVAGDPEAADGRMSPTVLQLAPDPEVLGGIVANLVPLQITVYPRALSASDYEAIGTLFSVAADLDDIGPDQQPYRAYVAAPWIPQAASFRPQINDGQAWVAQDADAPRWVAQDACAPWAPEDEGAPHWVADGTNEELWAGDTDAAGPEPEAEEGLAEPQTAHEGKLAERVVPAARTGSAGLDVRILGPFTISGAVEPLQPKQAELVLALALAAPTGLSNSALCSMLGADPDHPKPADAVRQIITRARRRLGPASNGQEYIIHAGNGQYLLHSDASLDWSLFRQLVATGQADDLRTAVSLITGQPFTGSYFWWIDIPLIETVRAEIVDAAETLAEFELATGSPRAAARAARAGLMAEVSAEQLWRAVMRAEHAAGNMAGVTEAWRRCLDAIEDVAPGGEPHPDTAALYRQLTAPARQHAPAR